MSAYCCSWNCKKMTQKHTPSIDKLIKFYVITMFSIPKTWRHNAVTIDMVEISTSSHPMYCHNVCLSVVCLSVTCTFDKMTKAKITWFSLKCN